jgi:hypothetical protein
MQGIRAGEAIELRGVAEQGAIAASAHIGHDAFDGGQNRVKRRAAALFQGGEQLGCLRCAAAFGADDFHLPFSGSYGNSA